jgi:PAS domain S-box-containing protein
VTGQVAGVQLIGWDVTARKLAEEELRKSQERFELAVLASQDGLSDWDVEANQVWYSPQMRAMLGYSEEEFPNRPGETEKRVHPDDHARWRAALHGHVTGATDHLEMEYRMLHKDGSYRWVRERVVALRHPDGRGYRIAGSREDITKRKQYEEELRKSRERFELALLGSQDGLWDWDLDSGVLYLSPWYTKVLGWEEHEYPRSITEWERWLHPDDRTEAVQARQAHLDGRTPHYQSEYRLLHKNGSYRWVRSRGVALRDSAGRPYRVGGSLEDITERKQAEDALARERDLLHTLMDNLPDGIYFKDAAGRFLRANQAVADYLGVGTPAAVVGKSDRDFFTEEHAAATAAAERTIMETGQPLVGVEEKVICHDGRVEWVSTTKLPFRDRDGKIIGTFGVSRNISAQKRAEDAHQP